MRAMGIGEVAKRVALRPSAIRYYEKAGLLPAPDRVSGRRRYGEAVLERLAIIRFAQRVGFRIAEIKLLLDGFAVRPPPERWRRMARQKMAEANLLIREATTMRDLLRRTLRHKCPKLVERGAAVASCPRAAAVAKRRAPDR
ncbi:MAG: MerR family transcriptional regulator [Alphaproteobacteria bacterium]|nr:MerR family transcriptional regulator [Alphaproteobacteria bacterium]